MSFQLEIALIIIAAYLLGSIPFGLVLTRIAGLGDIRKIGSGNIGATNVLRTGNKGLAAATMALDTVKGAIAVLVVRSSLFTDLQATVTFDLANLVALSVVLGHVFPVWLKFNGGKGVATVLGIWLALFWPIGVIGLAIWCLLLATFRISSLSALVANFATIILAWVFGLPLEGIVLAIFLTALVWWRHRANIARLLQGTEPKIGKKPDSHSLKGKNQ